MESRIAQVLIQFESLCENWRALPGRMEKMAPYAYVWHPETSLSSLPKPIAVTLQAATHGNEVGGIEVLLEVLILLRAKVLQPVFPIAFVLGNPAGIKANRRFVERDLNRSFGQSAQGLEEERRARLLEPLLEKTALFVDFHQTIEPTHRPFFIFPYTASSYAFAAALHRQIPIVTHWGPSFSKDGMCTDEFVNYKGGTGLTLELGQKGFDPYHTGVGLQVALAAVQYGMKQFIETQDLPAAMHEELYTWKSVIAYEEGMQLRDGLVNFQNIKVGDEVGSKKGQPLRADADGWLLFPKYPRDPLAPPPKELYRLVKRIRADELGKDGVVNR